MNIVKHLFKFLTGQQFTLYFGGGGGGGTTQSTGTTYNTNIPEYARPYVETMLGATQKQLFEGTPTGEGGYDITGFKPYQAYSKNPADYVAPFSPMQRNAQQSIASMQTPGEYRPAIDVTGQGIMGAMDTAGQAQGLMGMGQRASMAGNQYARQATNPYATAAYMSPYMQNVVDTQQQEAIRQSGMQRVADQAQAVKAGAFGGSRQALVEAERQRNLGTQLGQIQATGLQSAFDKAQANQQFAANLGLQGQQAGAGMIGQGIGAQQAAYNQAMQGAQQYANLGNQAQQAQINVANLQNQYGAQQQAAEQQKINQAIQDWSNQQQYPLMQLGVMSNMLRGLPMQASTTNQYVAAPNALTQGIGAAGSAASLYNAFKGSGNAEGGVIKEMASGGIASIPRYEVGGEVKDQLRGMSVEQLQKEASSSSSPTIRAMAKEILAEKQMTQAEAAKGVGPTGPMGVQYEAPPVQSAAQGGILAFKEPTKANNYSLVEGDEGSQVVPLGNGPKIYDVGNDPDVKATTSAFMGASQSGHQPSIDAYRAKMEDAVTNAQARAAADEQRRLDMTYKAQKAAAPVKPEPQVRESAGIPQAVPRAETTEPQLETAAGVAARTPEQKAEQARLADIYAKQRPAVQQKSVPAPQGEGIMQAVTKPAPQVSAPARTAGAPEAGSEASMPDFVKKALDVAQKPLSYFTKEQDDAYRAAGIDPENKAAQEQRAKTMAERANSADEERRQQWMRAAEFFGRWGSTPGPTLAAGLAAMQKTIPDLITDKEARKKANRELDKMAFDIDQAIRLEKKGNVDAAVKHKEKAGEIGMHLAQTYMTSEATRYHADKQLQGSLANAAAHAEGAKATRDNTSVYRAGQNLNETRRQLEKVRTDFEAVKKTAGGEYEKAARAVDRYEKKMANPDEAKSLTEKDRIAYDRAHDKLYGKEGIVTGWKQNIKAAEDAVKDAENAWKGVNSSGGSRKGATGAKNTNDPFGLR